MSDTNSSTFTGSTIEYIGISIATAFLSFFTLFLAMPALVCWSQRWIASNTYIDGRQLRFEGRGGELFGQFLLWVLLSIITLGIFAFFIPVKWQKWIAQHTHFA